MKKITLEEAIDESVTPDEVPTEIPPETPKIAPVEPPKYLWDNPTNVRHSVRVICDEEGLTIGEKNVICACIHQESQFDTKAKNKNKDGSWDLGLCQYNSYWYVEKAKLITEDQAMNDPEFCVRLMIKRYRQGFLRDWVSYKSGAYKKYL